MISGIRSWGTEKNKWGSRKANTGVCYLVDDFCWQLRLGWIGDPLRNQVGYTIKSLGAGGLKVWIIDPLAPISCWSRIAQGRVNQCTRTPGAEAMWGAAEAKLSGYTWELLVATATITQKAGQDNARWGLKNSNIFNTLYGKTRLQNNTYSKITFMEIIKPPKQ